MKKSVLLLFFAGCVATGIFGIGRKIPMNRVNDLGQREGYWRDSLGEGITHELYYKGGKKDGLFKCFSRNDLFVLGEYTADNISGTWYVFGDEGELVSIHNSIEFSKDSIYTVLTEFYRIVNTNQLPFISKYIPCAGYIIRCVFP